AATADGQCKAPSAEREQGQDELGVSHSTSRGSMQARAICAECASGTADRRRASTNRARRSAGGATSTMDCCAVSSPGILYLTLYSSARVLAGKVPSAWETRSRSRRRSNLPPTNTG